MLQVQYSPIGALNWTYALSKANSKVEAIREAEKPALVDNHLYHFLLANIYKGLNKAKAMAHLEAALSLAWTDSEKKLIKDKISRVGLMQ